MGHHQYTTVPSICLISVGRKSMNNYVDVAFLHCYLLHSLFSSLCPFLPCLAFSYLFLTARRPGLLSPAALRYP